MSKIYDFLRNKEDIPKYNKRLLNLRLHYFALNIPPKDVFYQLRTILGENLSEYCISCEHGSTDCLIILKNRINQQDCSFLGIRSSTGGFYTPKVFRVLNKKKCIQSLRTKNCLTNILTKKQKDPTIYMQVASFEDLTNVDTIIQALDPKKRPDVILAINYPGSTLESVNSQVKSKGPILDDLDPTMEMLNLVPRMPGVEREWLEEWIENQEVSRDPFSEQLFNLEKSLETIQTQKIDFLFYNLDSFGVRIVSKQVSMGRMKKVIEQFKQKMHTFLDKMLLKNIVEMGPVISIPSQMFPIFLSQAGSGLKRMKEAKSIQLQLMYLLLYFSEFTISEITNLTKNNLLELIEKGSTEILFANFNSDTKCLSNKLNKIKKKLPDLVSYPMKGNNILSEKLKGKQKEIDILFDTYGFSCLGSNPQRVKGVRSLGNEKLWLRIMSVDLMHTASVLGLSGKFSASSFKKKKDS